MESSRMLLSTLLLPLSCVVSQFVSIVSNCGLVGIFNVFDIFEVSDS
jgi:hypothetical protein